MISAVNTWLKAQLAAVGVPEARVFADPAELAGLHAVPFAIVMTAKESVTRDGSRVGAETSANGATRTIRRRLWARRLPVQIHLVHDSLAHADAALAALLAATLLGPVDAGNRMRVVCRGIDWFEDKSRTDSRVRVDVDLDFQGGVFRDQVVPLVKNVMPEPTSGQGGGA